MGLMFCGHFVPKRSGSVPNNQLQIVTALIQSGFNLCS
jgi:hypothetical protein